MDVEDAREELAPQQHCTIALSHEELLIGLIQADDQIIIFELHAGTRVDDLVTFWEGRVYLLKGF